MTHPSTFRQDNTAARAGSAPRLSVLIPFHRDDPTALIESLSQHAHGSVEIIAFDDGAPDPNLNAAVSKAVDGAAIAASLITCKINQGRSGARNRLAQAARGAWLLFLDADMEIDRDFLATWIAHMDSSTADALFGGFTPAGATPGTAVHAALAEASDVRTAKERARIGATAFCSSNLAVRASAFAQTPFDEGYCGWGWEDVDWALSAAQRFTLAHVENPVRHGGLETVDRLLSKFAQSGPNFARLLARHPDYEDRPGARLARQVKTVRAGWLARLCGGLSARFSVLPIRLRVLGLKLFRAGVAAQAL